MEQFISLHQLLPLESGMVTKIDAMDKIKRRFLDLGIIPGTKITNLYESPFKDPKAYLIRGAIIALRKEDADYIQVSRMEETKWD